MEQTAGVHFFEPRRRVLLRQHRPMRALFGTRHNHAQQPLSARNIWNAIKCAHSGLPAVLRVSRVTSSLFAAADERTLYIDQVR